MFQSLLVASEPLVYAAHALEILGCMPNGWRCYRMVPLLQGVYYFGRLRPAKPSSELLEKLIARVGRASPLFSVSSVALHVFAKGDRGEVKLP
jgi:hypothetical protein